MNIHSEALEDCAFLVTWYTGQLLGFDGAGFSHNTQSLRTHQKATLKIGAPFHDLKVVLWRMSPRRRAVSALRVRLTLKPWHDPRPSVLRCNRRDDWPFCTSPPTASRLARLLPIGARVRHD